MKLKLLKPKPVTDALPDEPPPAIRVCAIDRTCTIVGTWYRDGHAEIWHKLTDEVIDLGYVPNLDYFNEQLFNHNIQPVGMGRRGKSNGNL